MPIYEYRCQKCGHKFEELVLKKKKIKCPKCGSISIRKEVSGFGIGKKSIGNSCSDGTCNICPSCKI